MDVRRKLHGVRRFLMLSLAGVICVTTATLFLKSRPPSGTRHLGTTSLTNSDAPPQPDKTTATVEQLTKSEEQTVEKRNDGVRSAEVATVVDFNKIEAFNRWSVRWLEAASAEKIALTEEGISVATARRAEFKTLIINNPRRAIAESVPRVVRQDLPQSIQNLLEQPVSAVGELEVIFGRAAPEQEVGVRSSTLRSFKIAEKKFTPHFFGDLAGITSKKKVPLRGVAIDQDLAVAENAVRPLEIGERIAADTLVTEICPVSGITNPTVAPEQVVTLETPLVEVGPEIISLCVPEHVGVLEDNFRNYIRASGPGGGGFFFDSFPGTESRSIGNFRCLYIRATYPDQQTSPISEEQAQSDLRDTGRFYLENSYGKMTVTSTVTRLVTLPHNVAWYNTLTDGQTGLSLVHTDSQEAARLLGYDPSQYDCIIVRIDDGPMLAPRPYLSSWGGGNRVWLTWNGMDVMNHECGHSLGLLHANFWSTYDGTAYGYGQNAEYGNHFDVMGYCSGFSAHYNTVSKRALGWLPDSAVHFAEANGTYRMYAYDQPTLEEGKRYALTARKDAGREYNLEYHPARGGRLASSALVIYSGVGSNAGNLLDTTPGSLGDKEDGGIPVGTTYSDPEADMHFTVVGQNATTPPSLDITFNRGPFKDNVAPVATLVASTTTPAVGGDCVLTATASDPNGDLLAYRWECSDGESGSNATTYTRTFNGAAQVTIMLTVSDMKGGTVRKSIVIGAGNHGKQVISGTVTASGLPVAGVYLSGDDKYCYSNADGSYSLAGVSNGTHKIKAVAPGYTFTPTFTNPLTVAVGTNNANWTALGTPLVKLTKVTEPVEGGVSGKIRLSRSGSTSADLVVLVSPVTGTATLSSDYTFSTGYTNSGSEKAFTIPAGASGLDVSVVAINDTTSEGPESIKLQITGGAGYLADSSSALNMTLTDNDSNLSLVGVITPDYDAGEALVANTGSFLFSRIGQNTAALDLNVVWSGSATNGIDCAALPTTVTIPAGQNSVILTLSPTNDALIENMEEMKVTISTNSSAYLVDSAAPSAKIFIVDDDTPVLTVSVPDAVASEAGPNSAVFLVSRSGSNSAPLKVYYGLSGSALHGTDYAALTGEVTMPAGVSTVPIVITPYDDDHAEPIESVTLALANFANTYNIGTPWQASVDLSDNNDNPVVNVLPGAAGVEGSANPTFVFRTIGNGTGNIMVNYTLVGTATSGVDYTAQTGSISLPVNGSNSTTLEVALIDDSLAESAETLILKITEASDYRVFNDGMAEDVIFDNDSGGDRVRVSAVNQTPAEDGQRPGKFHISRTKAIGPLTVNYAMSGSAINGTDYETLSGSINIPDGMSGVDLTMIPINDTRREGSEGVTITILPGNGYGPDRPAAATYQIIDNEVPLISVGFQQASLATSERPDALGNYRDLPVVLSAASANEVTVEYYCAGGSATGDDVDWTFVDTGNVNTPVHSGKLTFLPGVTTQVIRLRIKDDRVREGDETMTVELRAPYRAALTKGRSKLAVIISDEGVPSPVVEERWAEANAYNNNNWTTAPDSVDLLPGFTSGISVGENYSRRMVGKITAPVSGPYTFWIASDDQSKLFLSTTSSAANKLQIANVTDWTPFQSWDVNASQKSAAITLTAGQSYYMEVQHLEIGGGDHVSVAWQGPGFSRTSIINGVIDSTNRNVRMLTTTSSVTEGSSVGPVIQVVLDRPAGPTPVTINYTASGTATNGSDYVLASNSLTFAPGEQMKVISLSPTPDLIGEDSETIIITLLASPGVSPSSPISHTVTLLDSSRPIVETIFAKAFTNQAINSLVTTAVATILPGQSITGWSIISGNTGSAFAISATGRITLTVPSALPNPGMVQLKVRAQLSSSVSGDGLINVVCNPAVGPVVEQRWVGQNAFLNQDWSGVPSYTGSLATMTAAQNIGSEYSRRLTTFLKPQVTGEYTFWLAGDDTCRLFLSPNGSQSNKLKIAEVANYVNYQVWDEFESQKSARISLIAGNVYWFEAQQRQGGGGDHLTVAWSGPGFSRMVISSSELLATAPGVDFAGPALILPNQSPTLGAISNLNLLEDSEPATVSLKVGDAETAANLLLVSASSSNQTLLPSANITLAGSGESRSLTVKPAPNQVGSSVITVMVDDGSATTTKTFVVTVTAVNDLPTISVVADQVLPAAGTTNTLTFSIEDVETAVTALTLTKSSSNLVLVPADNVVIAGNGAVRALKVTTAANQVGSTSITLSVSDGSNTTTMTFAVTVGDTPSQIWGQQYFGTIARVGNSADLADPDSDGMNNLLEYALGGNPIIANNISIPLMTRTASQLTFNFARTTARTDVNLTVQVSSDFVNWSSLASSVRGAVTVASGTGVSINESGTGATRNVQVSESHVNGPPSKRFMRVLVTRP